jgi:1-acyl-sn-glycerol-3-phosphate acyltransferase
MDTRSASRSVRKQPEATAPHVLAPLVDALGSRVRSEVHRNPFQRDPAFIERMFSVLTALNLYFATEFRGWDHVPPRGPYLIVGNHSGGAGTTDFAFLLYKWVAEYGPEAPLYSLAYDLLFGAPVIGPALRRLGIVPASHANARRLLARGAVAAVFPGGDYEVFRPWSERNRVDFGGHTGFISRAIASRVPVVPMTIHGAHQSTIVLTRGQQLAHLMGMDRLHVHVFPFIWNIPFGMTPAVVPSLQLPAKVTVEFGAPFDWSVYGPRSARDPEVLRRCYDEITGAMQATMNRLARRNPHPILSRLRALDLGRVPQQLERVITARPPRRCRPRSARVSVTRALHAGAT